MGCVEPHGLGPRGYTSGTPGPLGGVPPWQGLSGCRDGAHGTCGTVPKRYAPGGAWNLMGISPRGYASGASPALRGVAPLGRAFGLASTVRGVGENPRDSGRGCRCRGSFQRSSGQWAPWDSRGGVTVMSMCSASSHTQSCMAGALDGPPPCPWLPRPRPSLRPRGGPLGSDENLHRCVVEGWRASGVAPCPKAPASALPQAALRIHRDFVSEDGSPVC